MRVTGLQWNDLWRQASQSSSRPQGDAQTVARRLSVCVSRVSQPGSTDRPQTRSTGSKQTEDPQCCQVLRWRGRGRPRLLTPTCTLDVELWMSNNMGGAGKSVTSPPKHHLRAGWVLAHDCLLQSTLHHLLAACTATATPLRHLLPLKWHERSKLKWTGNVMQMVWKERKWAGMWALQFGEAGCRE